MNAMPPPYRIIGGYVYLSPVTGQPGVSQEDSTVVIASAPVATAAAPPADMAAVQAGSRGSPESPAPFSLTAYVAALDA